MKKVLFYSLIIPAVCIISCTACKKSSDSSSSNNTTTYFMAAKVGTDSFNASGTAQISAALTTSNNTLSIDGTSGSGSSVSVVTLSIMPYNNTTGTLAINPGTISGFASLAGGSPKYAKYGQIVLTTATSSSVAGTFSYTCSDSTKVTGAFSASVHTL